jgi:phage shock protein PspC (stress-responsive transcriptional regulator)
VVTRVRLRRRNEHRLVAGVAGGIADRLNAPVGFVRVVLGFAIVLVPWAELAYGAATLAIPARGSDRPGWDGVIGVARLAVVVTVPVLALAGGINVSEPFDGPLGWWLAYLGLLVAGATALLAADYLREHPRTPAETRGAVLAAVPAGAFATVFAAGVVLAPDVRWERVAPGIALVGAASLLLAARRGRAAPFVAPAMLSVAIVALVLAADMRLQGGVGDEDITPAPADGPVVARRAVGDLHLNLRRVTRGGRDATVDASVGVGSITVALPDRVRLVVDASVAKGQLDPFALIDGASTQGFDRRLTASAHPQRRGRAPGLPTIRLSAHVGLGRIELTGGPSLVRDGP